MSFGAEFVWILSKKLKSCCGRRVQKIEGAGASVIIYLGSSKIPENNSLTLCPDKYPSLLISWSSESCGISFISSSDARELAALQKNVPSIVNTLKSHLIGAELQDIEQLERDRILKFTFEKTIGAGFLEKRFLIAEIADRFSNLLLTYADYYIIETAKHIYPADNPYRTVLPGVLYRMPPKFPGILLEEWLKSPSYDNIQRISGFGKPLLKIMSNMDLESAVRILGSFYTENADTANFIKQKIDRYIAILPVLLPNAQEIHGSSIETKDAFCSLHACAFEKRKKVVLSIIQKEILRRRRQISDIEKLLNDKKGEKYRQYGTLIMANLWMLKRGEQTAELSCYDENGNEISLAVPMDPKLTPSQNAEFYFAKYKKITSAQERAADLLQNVQLELGDELEAFELANSINDAEAFDMLEEELGISSKQKQNSNRKKNIQLPPHKRFEFENAIIYAGLSAKGNRFVTFKIAHPEDIWFHVQGVPGTHVILRITDSNVADNEMLLLIEFCASLAVFYSKVKGAARQRVDYTKRKYVSPIRGGLANVTYKEFSTINASSENFNEIIKKAEDKKISSIIALYTQENI